MSYTQHFKSSIELDTNNLRHGTTTYFFDKENQKIHKTIEYSHGVKHGWEKCYHSTGDLYIKKQYKHGALTDLYYYNNRELLFSKTGINTTKPQVYDNKLEMKLIFQDKDTNITINNNAPEDICIAIARNNDTSKDVLEKLSNNKSWSVRRAVALNPNTSKDVLEKFSMDKDWVKNGVACNPNTPFHILEKLSMDELDIVRKGVAENPNTPPEILAILSRERHEDIRYLVSQNLNTSSEILATLVNDENKNISIAAKSNVNYKADILKVKRNR